MFSKLRLVSAESRLSRVRPGDPGWPNRGAWEDLKKDLDGRLISLHSPLQACTTSQEGDACAALFRNLTNPYFIQENPSLTQTLGWLGSWTSKASVYAAVPENATEIASCINFARRHNLRLVVKGGGHSYAGNSSAEDSLLIWTRRLQGITIHDEFLSEGAPSSQRSSRAVTVGAGAIWEQVYDAVTTKAGLYVQGAACTTVGVAGLIQGGGFGTYSK